MPLQYTGVKIWLEKDWSYLARDPQGGTVAVQISGEALRDYGVARALDMGSEKYDRGEAVRGSIIVGPADFK
jgi:hypothetical protein